MAFEGPIRRILSSIFTRKEEEEEEEGEETIYSNCRYRSIIADDAPITWTNVVRLGIMLREGTVRIYCTDGKYDEVEDVDVIRIPVDPSVSQYYESPIVAYLPGYYEYDKELRLSAKDPSTRPLRVRYAFQPAKTKEEKKMFGENVLTLEVEV